MIERRRFIEQALFTILGLLLLPIPRAWAKRIAIPLRKVPKLGEVNGSMILKIKNRNVLLIRNSQEGVLALDPTCTHKKCLVAFDKKSKQIECQCHGSKFQPDGRVLNGPAEKPLVRYQAELQGDRILLLLE